MRVRSRLEIFTLISVLSIGMASAVEARPPVRFDPVAASGLVHGAPTLPGCSSQASCRTASGGYLNGFHPVAGSGGGNGSPPPATKGRGKPEPSSKPLCPPEQCGIRKK
jgi:hypothetical protein